eukprot:14491393-Ditylum_brightwellii.AAC.1
MADALFKTAFNDTNEQYTALGEPLVSAKQINVLISLFKAAMSHHYQAVTELLGIDKKENQVQNKHLKDS